MLTLPSSYWTACLQTGIGQNFWAPVSSTHVDCLSQVVSHHYYISQRVWTLMQVFFGHIIFGRHIWILKFFVILAAAGGRKPIQQESFAICHPQVSIAACWLFDGLFVDPIQPTWWTILPVFSGQPFFLDRTDCPRIINEKFVYNFSHIQNFNGFSSCPLREFQVAYFAPLSLQTWEVLEPTTTHSSLPNFMFYHVLLFHQIFIKKLRKFFLKKYEIYRHHSQLTSLPFCWILIILKSWNLMLEFGFKQCDKYPKFGSIIIRMMIDI